MIRNNLNNDGIALYAGLNRFNFAPANIFNMNRTKAYWLSQFAGWLTFIAVNLIAMSTFDHLNWRNFLLWMYLFISGIAFTHIYRSIIKQKNWIDFPLRKLISYVILSSVVIGLILSVLIVTASIAGGLHKFSEYSVGKFLFWVINLSSLIFVWSLIYFSIHYFQNYKKAEIESYIWEAAVKDFELKTLKSQLNPHFMFNAMNSIRALIEDDPSSAKNALTKLSNILRYSLKIERNETVPLEEEMETVSDYLGLESIRFEERLHYKLNFSPGSGKVEIPPMMIQTLVENGIKHGISKIPEGGEIFVNSEVKNSKLFIEIKNSGRIDGDSLKLSQGFGINNTKHRLNLLYGEEASFSIENTENNFVLAKIEIPVGGRKNEIINNRR